jgi:hypothetical protein
MIYYWWVPVLLTTCYYYVYCSKWANETSDLRPMVIMYVIQIFGLWPIVAKYSQRLFFDGLLFDSILMSTYVGFMALFGATEGFTWVQWGGTALVITGLLLVKMG